MLSGVALRGPSQGLLSGVSLRGFSQGSYCVLLPKIYPWVQCTDNICRIADFRNQKWIKYYRVSHTYLTKVILLKMTLKCIVHLKGRHFYNYKDPPFDLNHQLMSADKCFVVNFDLKKRNWFLLFFLLFSTRNKDFLKMKQWNMVQVKLDRQKSLYFLHIKSFDSLFAQKIEKKS